MSKNIQFQKTEQEKFQQTLIRDKLIISSTKRPSGTTNKIKSGYATLYSIYRFQYRKRNRKYISREYLGQSTTTRNMSVKDDYGKLIRGAYGNAVHQFRNETGIGSKDFTPIHVKTTIKYWSKDTVDTGLRVNDNLVIKENSEKVGIMLSAKEQKEKELHISRDKYKKDTPAIVQRTKRQEKLIKKYQDFSKAKELVK